MDYYDTITHKWLRIPYTLHVASDNNPKKPVATVVLIHGIANSSAMWGDIVTHLLTQSNLRVITIDLLGFGASPKPSWQTYSAAVHAQSLRITLLRRRVHTPVIIVGHSLGTLIAVQYAVKYPRYVQGLLLCSPPFYKPAKLGQGALIGTLKQVDDAYHMLYRNSRKRSQTTRRLALLLKQAKLLSKHFTVNDDTMPAIVSSLEMSIENQTSLSDAIKLQVPITVIYGKFDPLVLKSHIKELEHAGHDVTSFALPVGHELTGTLFKKAVLRQILEATAKASL